MAAHLVGLGFEVLDEWPAVEGVPNDWGDPPPSAGCGSLRLGANRARTGSP